MDKLLYLLRCSRQALQVWRDLAPDEVHAGLPEERVPVWDSDGRALDLGQGVHVEVALGVAAVDAHACMREKCVSVPNVFNRSCSDVASSETCFLVTTNKAEKYID